MLHQKDKSDQKLVAAIDLNSRGAALEKAGDLNGALKQYQAALATDPDHVGIRTNVAIALLKLGHWQGGIHQLREALRRDPDNEQLKAGLEDAVAQATSHRIAVP